MVILFTLLVAQNPFLLQLFRAKAQAREDRAAAARLKQAKFPTYRGFEEFDTDFKKGVTRKQLDLLAKLEWLDGVYNLTLICPPGTGKPHIAPAIGNKVVRDGYNVAFHTMDGLVHILNFTGESYRLKNRKLIFIN